MSEMSAFCSDCRAKEGRKWSCFSAFSKAVPARVSRVGVHDVDGGVKGSLGLDSPRFTRGRQLGLPADQLPSATDVPSLPGCGVIFLWCSYVRAGTTRHVSGLCIPPASTLFRGVVAAHAYASFLRCENVYVDHFVVVPKSRVSLPINSCPTAGAPLCACFLLSRSIRMERGQTSSQSPERSVFREPNGTNRSPFQCNRSPDMGRRRCSFLLVWKSLVVPETLRELSWRALDGKRG